MALQGPIRKILSGTAALVPMLMLLISFEGFAQGPFTSRGGKFQVDQIIGCAPFTVNVTNTELVAGYSCASGNCFFYYEPTAHTQVRTHTYTTPGTYFLTTIFSSTLISPFDSIQITVLPNLKPKFEVYTCSLNRAVINITDKTYFSYFIDFGDGSPVATAKTGDRLQHTFPGSGTYTISVNGIYANGANNCDAAINVFNAENTLPPPVLDIVTALDDNDARIDFTAAPNLLLRPQIAINNATSFFTGKDVYGVAADTIASLRVSDNYYCIRLNTHDPCTGADFPSETICTQKFTAAAASDINHLGWVTEGAIANYDISRNSAYLASTPTKALDDSDIDCNLPYCYGLTANYASGAKSISLLRCVTSFSSVVPSRIDNASAVVSSDGVALNWIQNPAFTTLQYNIKRRTAAFAYQPAGATATPDFNDPLYTTEAGFCYRVNYTDQCKVDSDPGIQICPIRLSGTLDKANDILLKWSGYSGWKNGVANYTIERYDAKGTLISSTVVGTDTVHTDPNDEAHQVITYRITATASETGLTSSVSNTITVTKSVNLYYPTAFTPDHNDNNDVFRVHGFFIQDIEMHVFNRWGNMLFSTTGEDGWDGTYNGKTQPNDTYVWTASFTDQTGHKFSQTGLVLLLTK